MPEALCLNYWVSNFVCKLLGQNVKENLIPSYINPELYLSELDLLHCLGIVLILVEYHNESL